MAHYGCANRRGEQAPVTHAVAIEERMDNALGTVPH
jgi:hypothetical protein